MFSGIIEELGLVKVINKRANITLLKIEAEKVSSEAVIGESISVNGACLTVTEKKNRLLTFEMMPETSQRTNLGLLNSAAKVNLERSLRLGDRLSGHFVTGHIDCQGIIRRKNYQAGNLSFEIAVPAEFMKYVLPKGSIAVDGISLTIAGKTPGALIVYIIPHTLKNTTLKLRQPSDRVNIEFDILAKRP